MQGTRWEGRREKEEDVERGENQEALAPPPRCPQTLTLGFPLTYGPNPGRVKPCIALVKIIASDNEIFVIGNSQTKKLKGLWSCDLWAAC